MKNLKGETLEQFLANYNHNDYAHPSYSTDAILFAEIQGKANVLLIKRANHPYIDEWAFPGGFVEPNETAEQAVLRELAEETGITNVDFEQLYTVSTPQRDPRAWTVTTCFMGVTNGDVPLNSGDDAADAAWFSVDYVSVGDVYRLTLESDNYSAFAELDVKRSTSGKIDINATTVLAADGIAFDHSKLILLAIESL